MQDNLHYVFIYQMFFETFYDVCIVGMLKIREKYANGKKNMCNIFSQGQLSIYQRQNDANKMFFKMMLGFVDREK